MTTAIHRRVQDLRTGKHDPNLIARLPTGWAILGDRQPEQLLGCCTLLCDIEDRLLNLPDSTDPTQTSDELQYRRTPAHLTDLPLSPIDLQSAFLSDIARLARAVTAATACERVNILLLCNRSRPCTRTSSRGTQPRTPQSASWTPSAPTTSHPHPQPTQPQTNNTLNSAPHFNTRSRRNRITANHTLKTP